MSEKINDGGPAFPVVDMSIGMSLRDYFAAKALPSIMAHPAYREHTPEEKAKVAYMYADCMLEARQK